MAWPKLRRHKWPFGDHGQDEAGQAAGADSAPADSAGTEPAREEYSGAGQASADYSRADEAGHARSDYDAGWPAMTGHAPVGAEPDVRAAEPDPWDRDPSDDMPIWDWGSDDSGFELGPGDGFSSGFEFNEAEPAESVYPRPEPVPEPSPVPQPRPVSEPAAGPPPRPGIGQRRGNLAHLSADPRRRAWQIRALITVAIAIAFSIWISWRIGLTLAIVAAIADTVYRSRTKYHNPTQRAARGGRLTGAQRRTRRQLKKLRRAGYQAMHSNPIPGSEDQIDHLVVGPAGVFAIDSEAWDRRLPVRTKNARQLYHGPRSMKDRLEHASWEAQRAAEMLTSATGTEVIVRPVVAVYGPQIPWDVATIREVDVFSGPRLRKYLRRYARQSGVRRLSKADIERIYAAADRAFPHLNSGARVG